MKKNLPECSKCGDPIRWATTRAGKKIALEGAPDPKGNILLTREWDYQTATKFTRATTLGNADAEEARQAGQQLWIAHAAMCSANKPKEEIPPEIMRRLALKGLSNG